MGEKTTGEKERSRGERRGTNQGGRLDGCFLASSSSFPTPASSSSSSCSAAAAAAAAERVRQMFAEQRDNIWIDRPAVRPRLRRRGRRGGGARSGTRYTKKVRLNHLSSLLSAQWRRAAPAEEDQWGIARRRRRRLGKERRERSDVWKPFLVPGEEMEAAKKGA